MAAETVKYKRIGQFKSKERVERVEAKEGKWMWSVQNLYPFSEPRLRGAQSL